ncbi:hypothetical protein L917_08769 [Phytophthora nicotianae]|uniref:Uncharacterized protein n=1 Tax=Phytophthora nicotianae TaxID=4792 RepID=W2L852_PHYNI|nr:hypothetical protein L917_08769 [Phytophthora nicotianae]
MDTFSVNTAVSRRSWPKTLPKKKDTGQQYRKEASVTLPVLARRLSGQIGTSTRNNSLHSFLASQLEENDRESYSRSQLRAMANSKLLPSNNNNVAVANARIHSSAERLAPLDPASFEKTRNQQRRPLPEPIQAAINEVLAVRNEDESVTESGERCDDGSINFDEPETPAIPKVKRASPCKNQIQSRRPEWSRYIRRIMMTKGIQGSTLARYRRLVGIVARKNLNQSFAGAAERVVQYRLEFRSAVAIQMMIMRFLTRRRQAKQLQRHRAAVKIQHVWRRIRELEKQRKLAEAHRLAKIERLLRLSAARSIQRSFRKYRHICYLRQVERRQQEQADTLQKARLKLLRRYQSWRENSKRVKAAITYSEFTTLDVSSGDIRKEKEIGCGPQETGPCSDTEVTTNCISIVKGEPDATEILDVAPHQDILNTTEQTPVLIDEGLQKSDERLSDQELESWVDLFENSLIVPQQDESPEKHESVTTAASIDESQTTNQKELAVDISFQKRSSPYKEVGQSTSEIGPASEAKTVPEGDDVCDGNNEGVSDVEIPAALASPRDLERPPDLQVTEEQRVEELTDRATIAAVALARAIAAQRIVRLILPNFQARQAQRTNAVIQIQCLARVYLAKLCLLRVRLAALHSLRAQLLASWRSTGQIETKANVDESGSYGTYLDQHDDEDDDLDLELQGYQPSLHGVADNYIHVLPTRNGQIPPGVPLLQSSAGAPLLSLWKWSWPTERWISNNQ